MKQKNTLFISNLFLPTSKLKSFSIFSIVLYSTIIFNGITASSDIYDNECYLKNQNQQNIEELVKNSPVILKALGARIFDDSIDDFENNINLNNRIFLDNKNVNEYRQYNSYYDSNDRKNFFKFDEKIEFLKILDDGDNLEKISNDNSDNNSSNNINKNNNNNNNKIDNNNNSEKIYEKSNSYKNMWIALTPETIFKGSSLLKIVTQTADTVLGESYRYEGQLNATLEQFKCFDKNTLDLLPTELIVFGKLIKNSETHLDKLQIIINSLIIWNSNIEKDIWKYLGWDDWSDFTTCSVTCGKGVQQRFRRCLLDKSFTTNTKTSSLFSNENENYNENINLNMNNNNNLMMPPEESLFESAATYNPQIHRRLIKKLNYNNDNNNNNNNNINIDDNDGNNDNNIRNIKKIKRNFKRSFGRNKDIFKNKHKYNLKMGNIMKGYQNIKKKKTKGLTTLSCEGFNIEQRNCNMFDCTENSFDLLKYCKRISTPALNITAAPSETTVYPNFILFKKSLYMKEIKQTDKQKDLNKNILSTTTTSTSTSTSIATTTTTSMNNPKLISSLLFGWKNLMNFTIMLTLRGKLPKIQATIFSLQNKTHNFYIDQYENGIKLYQERDDFTEMLPIEFNLYDNRWHQIAISIQNGDFITIYVDCLWTNSFIVSKSLFALPDNADVEIAKEFNGDLQQLTLLPGNHEKEQCSTVRTAINEVKRYIIDTFIDDDGI